MSTSFFKPFLILLPCLAMLLFSCRKTGAQHTVASNQKYSISGGQIMASAVPVQLIGANSFHIFGAGGSEMNKWNLDVAREFIGDIKETPLSGAPIRDSAGSYLYSLQTVADSNRQNKRITIICAFGWDGTNANLFTGKSPAQTFWWNAYKTKLQQWAMQFKDQPDVWLEVWNEPYIYNRTDGYTDDVWLADMAQLVSIIRKTGNTNVILVPCAEQGQDESVLINKGAQLTSGNSNLLFDIHAYEKWLLDANDAIGARLNQLKAKKIPVIFGETAPVNAGVLMNPQLFLDSVYANGFSVCAWVWKKDATDRDALLTAAGLPNNNQNNNWGTLYQSFAARQRKP